MNRLERVFGIVLLACASAASAAPGDLDLTFGGTGVVTAHVGGDQGMALALDGSGNIVVGGYSGSFVNGSFLLARFSDVGAGGVLATTDFPDNPGEGDNAQAVLVDGSGRIVLVGSVNGRRANAEIGLARYLSNGTLDVAFDTDGRFEFNVGLDDRAFDAVLDGTGSIVLVGSSDGAALVARITDAGALDPTFDGDGIAAAPGITARAVAIDGTGRILVASDDGGNIFVSRYTAAGALDASFGAGGTATIDLGGTERAFALALDASERVIVAGSAGVGGASDFLVARLTSAGTLDASFNTTGSNQISVTVGADIAFGVDLTSAGSIVVGGSAGGDTGVLRLLDDGTLDPVFGTAGVVVLDQQAGSLDAGFDVLVDAEDRILVAGRVFTSPGNGNDLSVVRLQGGSTADLSITKTNGVATSIPGSNAVYTITASNAGPSGAIGATVADTFPAACTGVNWTCVGAGGGTCAAAGAGNINDTVDLPAGGSVTYTASCVIDAAATGSLDNTATITEPGGTIDPNPANNSATDSDTLTPSADLSISKTNGAASSVPGTNTVYTIVASNIGPSNAPGSTVADTFPAACTGVNWTCVGAGGGTCAAAGVGNINDLVNLPVGGSVTYTATCAISPTATGNLVNTATVAVAGGVTDPVPGNNSATDSDALTASADLAITKTNGTVSSVPGSDTVYTIVASNAAGPSDVVGATVSDSFPAACTSVSWSCVAAGGASCNAGPVAGDINDVINLPVGGTATYSATCSIDGSAAGTLDNTATIAAPGGVTDPVPGNNSATDSDALTASADLAITKTNGTASSVPGSDTVYTIVASNAAGPSDVVGATVSDSFPAACTSVSWSCVAAGGASCNAGPVAGDINDVINLPVGGTATYSATCSIDGSVAGTLNNTATIAAPGGVTDPVPGNNSATDSDTLAASADVNVTKVATGVPDPLIVGSAFAYTIVASNAGPSEAAAVVVTDSLPANLAYVSNSCGATFAAPTLTWNIGVLAAGVDASCTLNVTVSDFGQISNTANIATSTGDPDAANNSATAVLAGVTFPADVAISLTGGTGGGPLEPGASFSYLVTATNNGPGEALGLEFTLQLSSNFSFQSSGCGAVLAGSTLSWSVASLAAGGSTSCVILGNLIASGPVPATASVTTTSDDPDMSNNTAQLVVATRATPIPTTGTLGLLLLVLLVAGVGTLAIRRS